MVKDHLTKLNCGYQVNMLQPSTNLIGVVMDDIDGMSCGDRGGVTEIITFVKTQNSQQFKNPLICISNNYMDKKLSDLKKISEMCFVNKPKTTDLMKCLRYIIKKEKI